MKKTILILSMVVLALASQAQGIYNNGARIVSTTGSYWVVNNGDFDLTSTTATNLAQFANLSILSGSSLTLGTDAIPAYLTVTGTLANGTGTGGLLVKSGSSLIESSGAAATVVRAIPANEWHLISAPTSNAVAGLFTGFYLQKHTESTNAYMDITSVSEALTPARGYALYGSSGLSSATYSGPLNAGAESFSTTKSGEGWNLIGNPYPSSIDWDAVSGWTKTNVNAATYVHVNSATWATYVGSVGNDGGTQFIAPGQGFFVRASAAGTLSMTDAVRVHHATPFFKSSDVVIPDLVRLQVSGNTYTNQAVVRFLPDATAEFDGDYDAYKLFGDVPEAAQIYTTGSIPLSINSLPETDSVPVGVKAGVSGTYTIAATEINNLQFVTLEDTRTGIFTDLSQKSYAFSFTAGEDEMRFRLHFSALGIPDEKPSEIIVYSQAKKVFVKQGENRQGDIFIYNLSGQKIRSKLSASGLNEFGLQSTGIYIVKVISKDVTCIKKVYVE